MRSLSDSDRIRVDRMFGIYMGKRAYNFGSIDVLPVQDFLRLLYQGEVF